MGNSILVTGATGVVGRRAVPLMVVAGHRVTAAGRSAAKLADLERMGATPREVDLFDPEAVRRAVEGHEVVVNLATHIPPSSVRMLLPGAWRENDRIRRDASRILADTAIVAGARRFIQESFAPMYADGGDAWIDERSRLRPSRYNRSSVAAEASAQRTTENGLTGIVLRFGAFYGPDAHQTRDMIKLVRKGWAPLPGSPEAFVSSVSHDDAATAVVAALGLDEGVYNVVDDAPLTRREFADSLAEALGVPTTRFAPAWIVRLGGSLGEMLSRSLRISNRKLRAATGWAPIYPSVREGWPAIVEELEAPRETGAAGPELRRSAAPPPDARP
ncbi:MAG TPA: NAD(P)H-binding protein [Gemmatimonadota bacterium]|jgi:nucleoside-diphosphate-sugar epimerase